MYSLNLLTNSILFFLLLFSFYIIPPLNSSMITPIIIFIIMLFKKKNNTFKIIKLFKNKFIFSIYLINIFLIFVSLIIILFYQTFDFSYIKNLISQIIHLTLTILASGYIFLNKKNKDINYNHYAEKIIIYSFVIQSIIQIIGFSFPSFVEIIHLTYKPKNIDLYYRYNKIRGLALAGALGWGLAIGYGISFMFYVKHFLLNKKINYYSFTIGSLLIIGSFFSGRTALVGLIISVIYFLLKKSNLTLKLYNAFLFIFLVVCMILFLLFFSNFIDFLIDKVFPWFLEMFYNYQKYGTLETTSTNILLRMWENGLNSLDLRTLIFGDGYFTDPIEGNYYMNLDIGYLRNIFYGGVFWYILILIYHLYINSFDLIIKNKLNKDINFFIIFIFILLLIFELKAMTIGFNKMIFTILIFYKISLIYNINEYTLDK